MTIPACYVKITGMEILKEITQDWAVDGRLPNHTYLLNDKGQIIAFAKWHSKDRKSTRLNSSHMSESRMPSSA